MTWPFELHKTQPVAHAIGALAFVCVLGMALGSLKFRGTGLGTAGVLFAGILVGHFGEEIALRSRCCRTVGTIRVSSHPERKRL